MTAKERVLERWPQARLTRRVRPPFARRHGTYRIVYGWRRYLAGWCTTEERAWEAAWARIKHRVMNRDDAD